MGNCSATPQTDDYETKKRGTKKQNPFSLAYVNSNSNGGFKLVVLKEPTGLEIEKRYELGRELGRGEFGITYLCTDKETGEKFACKSISKDELRTAVDIEDVRRSRSRDVQHNNC